MNIKKIDKVKQLQYNDFQFIVLYPVNELLYIHITDIADNITDFFIYVKLTGDITPLDRILKNDLKVDETHIINFIKNYKESK